MSHAQVEICRDCGKHGRIILADGFIGLEFCFQRHALDLIRTGVEKFDNISPVDAELLVKAIRQSQLPLEWYMVEISYHWQIEQWNQFRIQNGHYHPLGAHGFLQQIVSQTDIPSEFQSVVRNAYPA